MNVKTTYLSVYNFTSAILWLAIAINNVMDIFGIITGKYHTVYSTRYYDGFPHKLLVTTQALNAFIEISHSIIGVTKSPLAMTCLQFFARCSITIGVCYLLPESPGNFNRYAFPTLTIAWSCVELIRYPYYLYKINNVEPPKFLTWLRYSAFVLLYPMGLLSEPVVIYDSLDYVKSSFHYYFFMFGFCLYIPGFYFLYTYMFQLRNRAIKGHSKDRKVR